MALPGLQGQIVVASATTIATIGGTNVTLSAATYYPNMLNGGGPSFVTHVASAMTTAAGFTISGSMSWNADDSTGKITFSAGSAFAVTWTDTTYRDILGFTGNLASGTSHTATKASKFIWLPSSGRAVADAPEAPTSDFTDDFGPEEVDMSFTRAPSGASRAVGYTVRKGPMRIAFDMVKSNKMWRAQESVGNESLQQFWRDCLAMGKGFRYCPDRSDLSYYATLRATDSVRRFGPPMVVPIRPDWTNSSASLWAVGFDAVMI